jgi:murein L,D-transpeptidase YcbB/YkuD
MGPKASATPYRNMLLGMISIVCFFQLAGIAFSTRAYADEGIADKIRVKLESVPAPGRVWVGCEIIHANGDLITFYKEHQFAPLWVNDRGLNDLGRALPAQLADSRLQGLDPKDYHLSCINSGIKSLNSGLDSKKKPDNEELADLDILMTDAFMVYASNLSVGRVDPEKLYPLWFSEKEKSDILAGMDKLISTRDLTGTIRSFAPAHEQYWHLVDAARSMEDVIDAGGWPKLPDGENIRPGEQNPQVPLLRSRLQISGELEQGKAVAGSELFDRVLEAAVKKFQLFHGLEPDGIVGPNTRSELNVTAEQRRDQILLNLERWRWLHHKWEDNYIIVNAAAFSLTAHRSIKKISMRVIVGMDLKRTPVFSRKMRYIEINPYWNVPRGIAMEELLPKIQEDPGYASKNDYEIISGNNKINPRRIDWNTINADNFPWRIRQKPGDKNALGHIKFIFPNRFDVYMHDTPYRDLFLLARRDLSHGCIRLQKPFELALFILRADDPSWTRKRLEQLVRKRQREIIKIHADWMVHFLYWTAWVNDKGQLRFCRDIYGRDPVLWAALNTETTKPAQAVFSKQ